jgi:hypothetical protein
MGGAEPSPFLAVQQAHLVSEARRLTAGGTPVVEEARGGGRGCYRTDLRRALAMVVGLRCLSLRRRRCRRTRWLCNLDKMCKLAKLLGKAAVLSIPNCTLSWVRAGAPPPSSSASLCNQRFMARSPTNAGKSPSRHAAFWFQFGSHAVSIPRPRARAARWIAARCRVTTPSLGVDRVPAR